MVLEYLLFFFSFIELKVILKINEHTHFLTTTTDFTEHFRHAMGLGKGKQNWYSVMQETNREQASLSLTRKPNGFNS